MAEPELWTTAQAAAYCGIQPGTWRDYVHRNGAPRPVAREPGRNGQDLYRADKVRAYQARRPGRGWHGPRTSTLKEQQQ